MTYGIRFRPNDFVLNFVSNILSSNLWTFQTLLVLNLFRAVVWIQAPLTNFASKGVVCQILIAQAKKAVLSQRRKFLSQRFDFAAVRDRCENKALQAESNSYCCLSDVLSAFVDQDGLATA